jgi:release factor glutamine methyltransferase
LRLEFVVSVRELLDAATRRLPGDEARVDAETLLAHVLGRTRTWLFAWPEYEPDASQLAEFGRLVDARERGEPVAYLVGHRGFWTFELQVTPAVLIPRPETELLVELALERLPKDAPAHIADLGTGSGAIALALASERPRARVLATDASADALAVARANAHRLGLRNVEFAQGDWCEALGDAVFDVIASNPPYIVEGDAHLSQGDLRFEPPGALSSGVEGLDAIRAIVAQAPTHLAADGWLVLEHGWNQAAAVRALLESSGYRDVGSFRDNARHERVTLGRRPR